MSGTDGELTPSRPDLPQEPAEKPDANPEALIEGNEVAHEEDREPGSETDAAAAGE